MSINPKLIEVVEANHEGNGNGQLKLTAPPKPIDSKVRIYSGVELQIRNDQQARIDPDCYSHHVISNYDANLEQKFAVAFDQRLPILCESGSGVGKSSTIERMCADLGWNCFYVNCDKFEPGTIIGGGGTDEDTKSGLTDWKDGIVVKAIRYGGVLVLDEYNLMRMENGAGRLHEILDAVLRGKSHITLSENKGERVPVHPDLQIVALQNPPNSPLYPDRNELGVANFSRFVYLKEPEDLPKEVWLQRTQSAIGKPIKEDAITLNQPLTRSSDLAVEDLGQIEGMESLLEQYLEFHFDVANLAQQGSNQQIATGQGQPLYFVYSRDSERVLKFIASYYNGNAVETVHRALEYYYVNKFETEEDREKVRELINLISLADYEDPNRKSLEPEKRQAESSQAKQPKASKAKVELSTDVNPVDYYHMLKVRGCATDLAILGLCGDDSPEAFTIREEAYKEGAKIASIVQSVAAVHGPEADKWRTLGLDNDVPVATVLESLTGTRSDNPRLSRVELLKSVTRFSTKNSIYKSSLKAAARSLVGRDDDEAKAVRKMIVSSDNIFSRTLRTTFHPGERDFWMVPFGDYDEDVPVAFVGSILFPVRMAFGYASRFSYAKQCLLESYAGLNTEEANELRNSLKGNDVYTDSLLISLAGLKDERHWNLRNEMLSRDHSKEAELLSVTLVDSEKANRIRKNEVEAMNDRFYKWKWDNIPTFGSLDSSQLTRLRNTIFTNYNNAQIVYLIRSPFTIAIEEALNI